MLKKLNSINGFRDTSILRVYITQSMEHRSDHRLYNLLKVILLQHSWRTTHKSSLSTLSVSKLIIYNENNDHNLENNEEQRNSRVYHHLPQYIQEKIINCLLQQWEAFKKTWMFESKGMNCAFKSLVWPCTGGHWRLCSSLKED